MANSEVAATETQAQLAKQAPSTDVVTVDGSPFSSRSTAGWELAQRMAAALSKSSMVPTTFQGPNGQANCMIAMEYAARLGVSVLAVMQHMFVIHGKPGLSSAFVIGSINASGRFTPLRYEFAGQRGKDDWACRAVAKDRATGEPLEGEWITWLMAKKEGWVDRKGSKWMTMSGQMMRYRAATFWGRTYCPEIMLGFRTTDELEDMSPAGVPDAPMPAQLSPHGADALAAALGMQRKAADVPIDAEFEEGGDVDRDAGEVSDEELERVVRGDAAAAKGSQSKLPGA